jgi:PKD domain/Malectin domain
MVNAVPSTKTPAVNNGDVRAIARVGNSMVIGGNFTQVNSLARNHVAIFDKVTGALSAIDPNVNGSVRSIVPGPNGHSVFLAGQFSQVGSTVVKNLALVDLNSGNVDPSFVTPLFNIGKINDLVLRGNRLYVAGEFTKVAGKVHDGLASLNATTGALDPFMNVQLTGHHNDSGSGAQGAIGPWAFDVTSDGSRMVAIGNFKRADGLLRDQVVQIDLTGPSASVRTDWATSRYAPYCFGWAFDSYVRGVSFSPDGSYFVVNATGGGVTGTLCDATTRWETNASGTDVQPTWVDETGGDTVWAVTITDSAIFSGGHARWANNPLGSDNARPGAVPRPGLSALDPVSGRPLTWNPGRNPAGTAVYAILATDDGLYVGSNTDWIGNRKYKRQKVAFFPYAGGIPLASTNTGSLPGTVYLGGSRAAGANGNVLYRVDAGGPAVQSLDNGPDWSADNDASSPYRNSGSNTAGYGPVANVDASVPASTPRSIFDTERWDPGDGSEMEWQFPVTAGIPIEVRLYLANRYSGTSGVGQRVFSVTLNGQPWLTSEDIVKDAGDQTGTMKSVDLNSPANGIVDITFLHETENPLLDGIEIIRTDQAPPPPLDLDNLQTVAFDGTSAAPAQAVQNGGIAWSQVRGSFMVGNKLFYGLADSNLYYRTFDGTTFGPAVMIDPYHDPAWKDVSNNLGGTYDGATPTLYGQLPNVTGMTYSGGRLFYTLFGDSTLHSRWFSPDSGIVDEATVSAPSTVDFSDADGMFVDNGKLYYASRSDGNLHVVDFANGAVTGSPTAISGPGVDGVDWRNRGMFVYSGPAPNRAPTAAFTTQCDGGGCAFDASGSADTDGTVASYDWDFGDGSTAAGESPTHTFTSAGTFAVQLTVTDNQGAQGAVTHQVTVSPVSNSLSYVGATHSAPGATKSKQAPVPAGSQTGDTMVLFWTQATTAGWAGPTGLTGWTQADAFTNASITTTVWTRTVAPGDAGGNVRFDSSVASKAALTLAVYRGVDTAHPVQAIAHRGDTTTASHTTASVSAEPGNWIVSYWADKSEVTTAWTAPDGVTTRDSAVDAGTGRYDSLLVDTGDAALGGSYGGLTATTDGTSGRTNMFTIALNPA